MVRDDSLQTVRAVIGIWGVLVLAVWLGGCASQAVPADRFYRLSTGPLDAATTGVPLLSGGLSVDRPESEGIITERALIYTNSDGSLARYRYDFWVDPPAELVQDSLIRALKHAAIANPVVSPGMGGSTRWVLRGRLQRFEQTEAGHAVVARLTLVLREAKGGNPLLVQTYERRVPTDAATPQATVAALSNAVDGMIAEFLHDVRRDAATGPR